MLFLVDYEVLDIMEAYNKDGCQRLCCNEVITHYRVLGFRLCNKCLSDLREISSSDWDDEMDLVDIKCAIQDFIFEIDDPPQGDTKELFESLIMKD